MSNQLKWKRMSSERPATMTNIVWRYPDREGLGLGWYLDRDKQEWDERILWIPQEALVNLPVEAA